ncbi:hypothetical protein [Luteithermobacter gelatinilyticus]|uniref:hypothetical protein n=1 Tax=Luteithermobacter gelatinilyticus TaxID=2582913 RepID=UPI001105F809|nr:hypothetical protein [Luteithermobacter gelatinilyticus]
MTSAVPTAILRVNGTECTLPLSDITVPRLLAEARAVGLEEFAVFCNGQEVASPDDLVLREGAIYVITPPETEIDTAIEIMEEDNPPDLNGGDKGEPDPQ